MKSMKGGPRGKAPAIKNLPTLTSVPVPEQAPEVSILDESNPRSLINLVPLDFAQRIKMLPKDYFTMGEEELRDAVKPSDICDRLKLRFWDEWQVALMSGVDVPMSIGAVFYGLCTKEYFYSSVYSDDKALAWMITPPSDYVVTMRDVLRKGITRLSEIIELPVVRRTALKERGEYVRDANGDLVYDEKVDGAMIKEIRQIVTMLADRVHGAIVHRLDITQKSLSMNVSSDTARLLGDPALEMSSDELSAIDAQIKKLGEVLDVTTDSKERPPDTVQEED